MSPSESVVRAVNLPIGAIDAHAVRDALRAFRFSKPIEGLALLRLQLLNLGLRFEPSPSLEPLQSELTNGSRAKQAQSHDLQSHDLESVSTHGLPDLLQALIVIRLASLRGQETITQASSAVEEILRLEEDFASNNLEREAWGLLYHRYFAADRTTLRALAQRFGLVYMTLNRRLDRGHRLLAELLREREIEARRRLELTPSGSADLPSVPHLRAEDEIVPLGRAAEEQSGAEGPGEAEPAPSFQLALILARLCAAYSEDLAIPTLEAREIDTIVEHPVDTLVSYWMGRVAHWSQAHYRLTTRFVRLTLLTDLGEDATHERWQSQATAHTDLLSVLADLDDPILALLGSPGSGKSSMLRRLELDLAMRSLMPSGEADSGPRFSYKLCFYIPLNLYESGPDQSIDPRRWLLEQWASRYPGLPPLDRYLSRGKVLLLLDGLNEIPHLDFADYSQKVRAWKQLCHGLVIPGIGNRIIFSCRSLDYSTPLSTPGLRVPQIRIEAMNDAQFRAFLSVYQPALADEIWDRIEGTRVQDLLRTAYLARLLVDEVASTGRVPEGPAALFTGFVRRLLTREIERGNPRVLRDWIDVQAPQNSATPDEAGMANLAENFHLNKTGKLISSLAELAFTMQSDEVEGRFGGLHLYYDEALLILTQQIGATDWAEKVLSTGTSIGLLDEDRDRDTISFYHQLLQEYFAGRYLARNFDPELVRSEWRAEKVFPNIDQVVTSLNLAEFLPSLPQTGWEESMILAVAMHKEPEVALRELMATHLAFAGRAAGHVELLPRLPADLLDDLRQSLLDRLRQPKADLRDRIACGLALGELGDPRFVRHQGPYGDYLLAPMIDLPGGTFSIGHDAAIKWEIRGDSGAFDHHIPRHFVDVQAFALARFPVTNAEWQCFIDGAGYEDEEFWDTPDAKRWRIGELPDASMISNNRVWRDRFLAEPGLLDQLVQEGLIRDTEIYERWQAWLRLGRDEFESVIRDHWRGRVQRCPKSWEDARFRYPNQPVSGICWFEARAYAKWLSVQSGMNFRLPTEVEWESAAAGPECRPFPWGGSPSARLGQYF